MIVMSAPRKSTDVSFDYDNGLGSHDIRVCARVEFDGDRAKITQLYLNGRETEPDNNLVRVVELLVLEKAREQIRRLT